MILSRKTKPLFASCFFILILSSASAQFNTVGDAQALGGNCFEITDDFSEKGAVWWNQMISLSDGFDITFHTSIMSNVNDPTTIADGIAFVLHRDPAGTNATSQLQGNTLGYGATINTTPPCAPFYFGGISPSIAVELDINFNPPANTCIQDVMNDHISIVRDGQMQSPLGTTVDAMPGQGVISTSVGVHDCRAFRITYDGVGDFRVYYDGNLRQQLNINLQNVIFSGADSAYFGITGATGGIAATQTVCFEFAQPGSDTVICQDQMLALSAAASPGSTYNWFPANLVDNPSSVSPNFTASVTPGLYTLQLEVENQIGCIDTGEMQILVNPNPQADAGATTIGFCEGGNVQLQGDSTGGDVILWTPSNAISTTDTLSPIVSPANSQYYYLTVTDTITGCFHTDSIFVQVNPIDSIDILTEGDTICLGDTLPVITYSDPGIDTWSWAPAASVVDSNQPNTGIAPTTSGTWMLTGTNSATGCSYSDTITIGVADLQVIQGGFTDSICRGEDIQLLVLTDGMPGNLIYSWSSPSGGLNTLSGTDIPDPLASPSGTSTYVVTVSDTSTGCVRTETYQIDVFVLTADVSPTSISVHPGTNVQLQAQGGTSYVWFGDGTLSCTFCPNPVAKPVESTTYTVIVTDENGCEAQDSVLLEVIPFTVSNVFTPNGDNINDVFKLNYLGEATYQAYILDRWGQIVYENEGKALEWNGKLTDGRDAPEGVYFLQLMISGDAAINYDQKQRGFPITLMR